VASQQKELAELRAILHLVLMGERPLSSAAPSPASAAAVTPLPVRWCAMSEPPIPPPPIEAPPDSSIPELKGVSTPVSKQPEEGEEDLPDWLLFAAEQLMDLDGAEGSIEKPELPPGWQCAWSEDHSRTYYFSSALQLTQWTRPQLGEVSTPSPSVATPGIARQAAVASPGSAAVEQAVWASQSRLEAWAQSHAAEKQKAEYKQRERSQAEERMLEEHGQVLHRARRAWAALDMEARARFEGRYRRKI